MNRIIYTPLTLVELSVHIGVYLRELIGSSLHDATSSVQQTLLVFQLIV